MDGDSYKLLQKQDTNCSDFMADEPVKLSNFKGLKLNHNFGRCTDSKIYSIVASSNHIFVSDIKGRLRQYSLTDHVLANDFGKIMKGRIVSMCISYDQTN